MWPSRIAASTLSAVAADDVVVAGLGNGRRFAPAHARRPDDAHFGRIGPGLERVDQRVRACDHATETVAHADGQRRRRRLAFLHDVEMGVEGRDLVDLGLGQLHLVGQRRQMGRRQVTVSVLDQVQILDQQIALPRRIAQQGANPVERGRIDLAALGNRAGLAPPGLGGLAGDFGHVGADYQPVRLRTFLIWRAMLTRACSH